VGSTGIDTFCTDPRSPPHRHVGTTPPPPAAATRPSLVGQRGDPFCTWGAPDASEDLVRYQIPRQRVSVVVVRESGRGTCREVVTCRAVSGLRVSPPTALENTTSVGLSAVSLDTLRAEYLRKGLRTVRLFNRQHSRPPKREAQTRGRPRLCGEGTGGVQSASPTATAELGGLRGAAATSRAARSSSRLSVCRLSSVGWVSDWLGSGVVPARVSPCRTAVQGAPRVSVCRFPCRTAVQGRVHTELEVDASWLVVCPSSSVGCRVVGSRACRLLSVASDAHPHRAGSLLGGR